MTEAEKSRQPGTSTDQARQSVRQVEHGNAASAERLRQQEQANPEAAEAAEQEASDGPDRRGLSR